MMAIPIYLTLPASRCLRCVAQRKHGIFTNRSFATTASKLDEGLQSSISPQVTLDPVLVSTHKQEKKPAKTRPRQIGSERRRAAIKSTGSIPFEQLPYQCFQEARKILQADREDKIKQIEVERKRIANAEAQDVASWGGEASKKGRLIAMHKHLEHLKILADINDPVIKKRFEDDKGDMNRPIYRYLADRQWRSYKRLLIMQRITQMHIVPDIVPFLDPVAEVTLAFGPRTVQPGEFVDSRVSEIPPRLRMQVFDKGERLVTIVVVDPDVPNEVTDTFENRCHFLAVNVPVSPTSTSIPLSRLGERTALRWLPPFSQKGSPYHRLAIFVLQQPEGGELDLEAMKKVRRDGFSLRSFKDRHALTAVGVNLFRSQWDEGTAGVMERASMEGADIEFHRKKPEKLPYKKKDGARYR